MRESAAPDFSFSDMQSTIAVLTVVAGAVIVALAASVLLHRVAGRIGQHSAIVADLAHRGRRPIRLTLVLIAIQISLGTTHEQDWTASSARLCGVLLIAAFAWCVTVLAFVFEELALLRYRVDVVDNRHARRVRTQVSLLRRITVAVISVIAAASILMTIPSVRVAGASIFASAGVVGIVAGLAAQTSLANVFAGLQIAFTDAMRVDDVVVVEEEWGRIEEITLTYVVVHIWDDRRMILPSTYFTTTPFQNWTRKESAVLGAVELDLDWEVPIEEMRAEMHRVLEANELWDRRVCVLQVTDAIGDHIRIRVLVSGKDGPTTFDLRCHVREALVLWLQRNHPGALPRTRVEFGRPGQDVGSAVFGQRDSDPTEFDPTEFDPGTSARTPGQRSGADARRDGSGRYAGATGIAGTDHNHDGHNGARRGSAIGTLLRKQDRHDGSDNAEAEAERGGPASSSPSSTQHSHSDISSDASLFSGDNPDAARRARDFSEAPSDPDDDSFPTNDRSH